MELKLIDETNLLIESELKNSVDLTVMNTLEKILERKLSYHEMKFVVSIDYFD